ncbi:hypothetical protein CAEBREN_07658 [Caenorhabditis brenneri]|uniref:RING-type domain-containing protein n=1 Tax=Caenorhabditis brenneri TaxID=135651 RepID=G0MLQ3_CAEBE|nr:hypothetical protein CAEBREN_07658 [Caenorhabditis brenneri]
MDGPKMAVGCGHTYCTPCIEQLDRRPCPKLLSELDRNATEKQDMLCSIWKRSANEDALRKQLWEKDAELKAIRAQLAEVDGQLARQTAAIREVTGEVGRCPACWDHMDAPQVTGCGHTLCQECMTKCREEELPCCGHTYCTPCIEQLDRRPCPVCRLVITDTKPNFSLAELSARFAEVLARHDD